MQTSTLKNLLCLTFFSILGILFFQNVLIKRVILKPPAEQSYYDYDQPFDPDRNVLVFLHIQKTGGTEFDRNIVKNLQYKKGDIYVNACEKDKCIRNYNSKEQWYIGGQTFNWECGVHPTIGDLRSCVPNLYSNKNPDNFVYFTVLREPFSRYFSLKIYLNRKNRYKNPDYYINPDI